MSNVRPPLRQGDVLLVYVNVPELPPVARVVNQEVVVKGERTQHCHTLVGEGIRVHNLTPEMTAKLVKSVNNAITPDQIVGLYSTDHAVTVQHGKLEHINKEGVIRDHSTFKVPEGVFIAIRQVEGAGTEQRLVQD